MDIHIIDSVILRIKRDVKTPLIVNSNSNVNMFLARTEKVEGIPTIIISINILERLDICVSFLYEDWRDTEGLDYHNQFTLGSVREIIITDAGVQVVFADDK